MLGQAIFNEHWPGTLLLTWRLTLHSPYCSVVDY